MKAKATETQPSIELRRYWDILVARWRVIIGATVVGLMLAVGYLLVVPSTFVSTTTVSVFPITTEPYAANRNSSNLIDMSAESVTASSYKVAELAAESADGDWDTVELRRATTTTPGADSTTMTITVTADTEARARAGAAAVADAYLQARSDQAANSIDSVLDRDRERIEEHREQLTDAIHRLTAAEPGSSAAAEASADQQTLNLQISALLTRISSLEGIDTTGGVVLNPATMTNVTVKPSRSMVLATGLATGFGIGVIAAFVTHSRRRRVTTSRDLALELQVPTLGVLESREAEIDRSAVASLAQRVLRTAEENEALVVAVVCDRRVPWPAMLADGVRDVIRDSGETCEIAASAADVAEQHSGLVLLPIGPDASAGDRLHGLRVSDVTLIVVQADATSYKGLEVILRDAEEMGAPVVGAILLTRSSAKARSRR